jgi:hypothetical protein
MPPLQFADSEVEQSRAQQRQHFSIPSSPAAATTSPRKVPLTNAPPQSPPPTIITPSTLISLSERKKSTVIIFDWDDTLLASSYLSGAGCRLDTDMTALPAMEIPAALAELEQAVTILLNSALSHGEVHIITNAELGWVELSAFKYLPAVAQLLPRCKVLSARSTYESIYPDSPMKWKFYAFQERLNAVMNDMTLERNIISLGDSHVEREAVRAATRGYGHTRTKSVKFAERPSAEQLRRQLELVTQCFAYIHNHQGDLDLQLTVTVNHQPTPSADADTQTAAQPAATSPPASSLSRDNDMCCDGELVDETADLDTPMTEPTTTQRKSLRQAA